MKRKIWSKQLGIVLATVAVAAATPQMLILASQDSEEILSETQEESDFSYDISNDEVTITKYNGLGGAVTIPSEVDGYTVTGIGKDAFKNATEVTSVVIPDSVKEIESNAFYHTGLTELNLPSSLETLGTQIIAKTAITEITIPKGLKSAGINSDGTGTYGALSRCDTLEKVVFEDGITTIPKVCYYSESLKEVVLPSSVTRIESYAFKGCSSLAAVELPANLKEIDSDVFRGTALTNLVLPEGIEKLGGNIIAGTGITEITIPKSLKSAGVNSDGAGSFGALSRCDSLKKVILEEGTTSVKKVCAYSPSIEEVVIPSSVTKIESYAFIGCTGMEEIVLPTGVTEIGAYAFAKTTAQVVIYDKVKTIHSKAFSNAENSKIIGYRNSFAESYANENGLSFEAIGYAVKFDANGADGGSTNNMDSLECGVSYNLNVNGFQKTGYKYKEWNTKKNGMGTSYKNQQQITNLCPFYNKNGNSIILYAQWNPIQYSIQFDGNGADKGSMEKQTKLSYDQSYGLKANAFQKSGYKFTGWNTRKDGKGNTYANTASIKNLATQDGATVKLYAQWKMESYSIQYELNGGKNDSKNPTSYNVTTKTIELSNPTKKGNTFAGWYSDKKFQNKVTKISKGSTGNKTLYAKWTANKYTIKFDGNGATGGSTKKIQSVKYGNEVQLTKNGFKCTGYQFAGWNTQKDGKGTTYKNNAKVKNLTTKNGKTITLYAQWKLQKYNIQYELKGGKNSSKNPATYTMKTKTIKLENPTRKGYKFKGWYSDSKYKKQVKSIAKGSTGNKTLYAKWEKK